MVNGLSGEAVKAHVFLFGFIAPRTQDFEEAREEGAAESSVRDLVGEERAAFVDTGPYTNPRQVSPGRKRGRGTHAAHKPDQFGRTSFVRVSKRSGGAVDWRRVPG